MPTHFEFRSIFKTPSAKERDAARTAHRVLREAEIRQEAREERLITFTSLLGSDPVVSDTDKCPPMDIGEA